MGDESIHMKPASPEQAVFAEALQCATPEARAAYLASTCGTDTALRRRVEALLRAAENAGDFLEQPPVGLAGDADSTSFACGLSEKSGDRIGRYKLLEQIGEGGCGVVYMAEQEEPVRRRVALKVIKLGMDTKSVIARFEAERQALALMDHPNIAKVFDGGATQTGRPYFVMELVRGLRITEFCDEARLPTDARLRLFVQVCQAVQHAHQKGIIHRDLKPSNILVTVNDGAPVPKVIDFGIAKATGQKLTDKTLFTHFHAFIGTPAYTSPEQAEMSSVDVDTRSDIYSLGVLLYELLTGCTPFDGEELLRSGLDEMRRTIREQQPVRPSTCLNSLGLAEATVLSGKRQANILGLSGAVRGDLDWVVMKCLEKDRARRYETANGLARDIERHLASQPVTARPPSNWYLLQKLARRHRGALFAASGVLLALLVAVLTLALSNAGIRRERNQKDQALRERGAALEAARASEQQSREQLFASLQSQAQARRNSRQMGQRVESLAALTEAARIHSTPELRDSAIAAMAMPDVQLGPPLAGWDADAIDIAYDSSRERYARIGQDGIISIRTVVGDRELQRLEPNLLTTGAKHGDLTFSPDGRILAWIDEHSRLGLWRWESGVSVLNSPSEKCSALAFSPDGRRLAVAHEARITCFDLDTGVERLRWQTQDWVFRLDFHPDSRQLAVGFLRDGAVSVYNADNGASVFNLPIGDSYQTVVAWHPDGELLAAGGGDSRIQIWNVKTQRKVALLEGHAGYVSFLNFLPRGDLLASLGVDGVLRLWQPSPERLLMRLPMSGWIAFSGAGRWAGVISPSRDQAKLWGIVPSEEYQTFLNPFAGGEGGPREGDISPDGNLLALATAGGLRLWDIARGREVAQLPVGAAFAAVFRDGGRELLTCGPAAGLLRWRIEPSNEPEGGLLLGPARQIALPFAPMRMVRSRDDRTLTVVGEAAGQVVVLDLPTESVRVAPMRHELASFVASTPDGERLVTSGWHSDQVRLWDGPHGKLLKQWNAGKQSRAFITPDGREMILSRAQDFTFHDLNTLKESRRLPRDLGLYPGYVAFTADGKLMALEMAPGIIHLKDIGSGRTVARLEDPQGDLSTWMGFTPDGTQLVVAARYAGAIHRWDLRAIRSRLKEMNLDWDWPEFPSTAAETLLSKKKQPLRVQVVEASPARP